MSKYTLDQEQIFLEYRGGKSPNNKFGSGLHLFLALYIQHHKEGEAPLLITKARKLLLIKNPSSQNKHLNKMVENGYLLIQVDIKDRRKVLIFPTSKLIDEVDDYLEAEIEEQMNLLRLTTAFEPFPNDSLPFSGQSID